VQRCVESRNRPDDSILRRPYPIVAQQRFVHEVAESIGFDFDRGRLDTTEHPFCSTAGPDDCRITTRWDEGFLPTALYGVLHEAGPGLYEQGLPRQWFGLPPGEAAAPSAASGEPTTTAAEAAAPTTTTISTAGEGEPAVRVRTRARARCAEQPGQSTAYLRSLPYPPVRLSRPPVRPRARPANAG
jgi:hypothetical protein